MSVLNNIKQYCKNYVQPPTLTLMICHEIERYYIGKQYLHNPLSQSNNSNKLKLHEETLCIQYQSTMGWEHFVRGRISKHIYHVISFYYFQKKASKEFTTKNWYSQIIHQSITIHRHKLLKFCNIIKEPIHSVEPSSA